MRHDALGLFWQDYEASETNNAARPLPPIPDTNWQRPKSLPRLDSARFISLDTETYDPNLIVKGPGFVRLLDNGEYDGYIVGVSIATEDAAWYFPLRHPDSDNCDEGRVFAWLRKELSRKNQPKIGANISYDIGWLRTVGVHVQGTFYDVQYAEPLLDENAASYSLDSIALKYEGRGKQSSMLYDWCAQAFGGIANETQRANIYRTPASLVGPYAEADAVLPSRIIRKQIAQLKREGLYDLFCMEISLIPLLLDMHVRGVRVDTDQARIVSQQLQKEREKAQAALDTLAGNSVNVNAAMSIAEAFDHIGIRYKRSASGNPSFTKEWLASCTHPIAKHILQVRHLAKANDTFIESYIFKHQHQGRIHPQLHPLRTDNNGTVSGRFAASTPNSQNIPSRDEYIAPLIRSMYVPDDGAVYWRRFDYSQIEYRLLAHFASGLGAEDVRDAYRANPNIDFHDMVTQLIYSILGIKLDRKLTKNINFGLVYGMSEATLRNYLRVAPQEAQRLFDAYHTAAPFIRHTYDAFSREAASMGEIRTLLGRKRRFIWYESASAGISGEPLLKEQARKAYGFIRAAYTHKALNSCLQGSAADIIKQAMSDAYYAGIFDVTGVPHVQVHDELGLSDNDTPQSREAFRELQHIMENCVRLQIPIKVDVSRGLNWGECK